MNNKLRYVSIFEVVRDIPYGNIGSRSPLQVLKKRKGSCSGKHLLLGYLYQNMGIQVQYMMCLTKFNFIQDLLPDNLKLILKKHEIYDYHNYLRIFVDEWLDVDATFDNPLKNYGFPVNDKWDCASHCKIAFRPIEVYQVNDLIEEKKEAIKRLPREKQKIRKIFLKQMDKWMESIR